MMLAEFARTHNWRVGDLLAYRRSTTIFQIKYINSINGIGLVPFRPKYDFVATMVQYTYDQCMWIHDIDGYTKIGRVLRPNGGR